MRLNKYTLIIENYNTIILYNIITKILIEIDCKKDEIQSKFINQLDNNEIEYYKQYLLISEDDNDDVKEMMEIKNRYNFQSEIGRFLIHLGYNCNLRCTYCYQSSISKKSKKNIINCDNIVKFIQNVSKNNEFEIYDICYIGGEPFIYWEEMINISKKINSLFFDKRIIYSVVTNGTMLDDKHGISELVDLGLIDYQVTIDGTKEYHDLFRRGKSYSSFDKIMENIRVIKNKYSNIFLSINCNLSKKNIHGVQELFDYLKYNQIDIPVSFSIVFDNGKNIEFECHSHNVIWRDAHIIAIKNGQNYDPFYRDLYLGCALTQKNYHVIGADGNIYKCINAIDDERYLVTHINKYGSEEYNNKITYFMNYAPDNEDCKKCELFPICYGGCEYRNRLTGFKCEKELFYDNEIPIIREIVNAKNK